MWRNFKLLHMWRNFRFFHFNNMSCVEIWNNTTCGETSEFSTSVTFRNLKFLHVTDFSPPIYRWQIWGMHAHHPYRLQNNWVNLPQLIVVMVGKQVTCFLFRVFGRPIESKKVFEHIDACGFPANSHHDKIPPWWEYVINRWGGFLSPAYSHHW